jgi:hypothetical protein
MKWIDPVFDRTSTDVTQRLQKAFFNVSDWLRITGNTEYIRVITNIILSLGIQSTALEEPTISTLPRVADINQMIQNIDQIREAVCLPPASGVIALKHDYKAGNSADAPDYQAVNAWERDIQLIRDLLRSSVELTLSCGTFSAGQDRIWAVRWRPWTGFVKEAFDPRRLARPGSVCGSGLTRQNRWRSPIDHRKRITRCGFSACGAGWMRQNGFRRY